MKAILKGFKRHDIIERGKFVKKIIDDNLGRRSYDELRSMLNRIEAYRHKKI